MPRRWEVIGGGEHGGLVVRDGRSFASRQAGERLATGAIVEEVEVAGERLHFRLLTGKGPPSGWISTTSKGKELARPLGDAGEASPTSPATPTPKGQPIALTREQAWALQEELLQAYSKDDFQRRLLERWTAAGPDPVERTKARQEVCLEVQGPIIGRYGFEASRKGVALSVGQFRRPEFAADQELAERNMKLGWLADPGQRPELQASGAPPAPAPAPQPAPAPPRPAPAPAPEQARSAAAAVQLTREQASAMQDELLAAFVKGDFQQRLHAAWQEAGDSQAKKTRARQQVCLEVQGPIVARYGFDASFEGVMHSMVAFSAPHIAADEEIQAKTQQMLLLINPDEQARLRRCGSVRVWGSDAGAGALAGASVDLARCVRDLKVELEAALGTPWHSQRLWLGELELEDHWPLEGFLPQDGAVDLAFSARRPEVRQWLSRLAEGAETRAASRCLEEAPAELLADEELVLPLVSLCRWALRHAAPALRAERRVVEAAVRHGGAALEHAAEGLRADRELVLLAVAGEQGDAWALQFAAPALRADREVVRRAVLKDGWALQFSSDAIRADREIVLLAAKREGWILSSISSDLQADRDVVLAAVRQNWEVLECVVPSLRNDREVVLAGVRQDGWALEFAGPAVQGDREVVLEAVRDVGEALRFAALELQADREVAMAAVSSDGLALALVPACAHDFEMVLTAVSKDLRALAYVEERMKAAVLEALGFKGGQVPLFMGGMPQLRTGRADGGRASAKADAALAKHFQTLGLEQSATVSQVRRRYRALALEHHPDKNPEDPQKAKEAFQTVNTAYQAIREALGF